MKKMREREMEKKRKEREREREREREEREREKLHDTEIKISTNSLSFTNIMQNYIICVDGWVGVWVLCLKREKYNYL